MLLLAPAAERVVGTFENCTSSQTRAHKEHAVNYAVRELSSKHASCVYANRELKISTQPIRSQMVEIKS